MASRKRMEGGKRGKRRREGRREGCRERIKGKKGKSPFIEYLSIIYM